jgi:hexokinase
MALSLPMPLLSLMPDEPGSMAEVPKDLQNQIKEFEDLFTVDCTKLKQIVDHFVHELEKGQFLPREPTLPSSRGRDY